MQITRRQALSGLAGAIGATAAVAGSSGPALAVHSQQPAPGFPRKTDFAFADGVTYINGAFTHPMPTASADAYRAAVLRRSTVGGPFVPTADVRTSFAALINARPSEIGLIPNTSTGENFVVESLGLVPGRDNIVTDGLHFEGALVHLMERKKRGLEVRVVMPRDGRIHLSDLEKAIDRNTKLVEVSFVAMYNGFQHDLKAVCDLAHASGALVYADIIQGVGAVPFDVRAAGVDFAATSTYKWLMGDFGLGFMFVKEDLLDRVVHRPHWSYESAPDVAFHWSPSDPESPRAISYTPGKDAGTFLRLGTVASSVAAAMSVSLPYIQQLGVANIEQHRIPLVKRLQAEMPRLGFTPQTPPESTSPIVTFAHKDLEGLTKKLAAAKVDVRVAPYWVRIAPSVYNDMLDIDRLLNALS
ncbi:MAG TPA: aminotransferase class V-fold PLP-dependent enzyme [Vicinamibacterales bacterium]|nr:aminotransferase class V-fold PLP-dependent enzyme [Vicinamibacterales bacterium]